MEPMIPFSNRLRFLVVSASVRDIFNRQGFRFSSSALALENQSLSFFGNFFFLF